MTDTREPPDQFWDDLCLYIEEGKVIPVIGPDLVTVQENGVDVPLHRWLVPRLAEAIGLTIAPDDTAISSFTLNDAVLLYVQNGGTRAALYSHVLRILLKAHLQPSPALQTLAAIPRLDLFVSLTFDTLLADAIVSVRPGTVPLQIAYSGNAKPDLPAPREELHQPVVYHLLGKVNSSPDFAICDEDVLEFIHALQDRNRQPSTLFGELKRHHLLILGCEFDDWLARFFLRAVRGIQFSQQRKRNDYLVGSRADSDPALVMFLECFGAETQVWKMSADSFIAELARRWQTVYPKTQADVRARAVPGVLPSDGAVFVSYCSEDVDIAQRLVDGLRAADLEVWFDRRTLEPAVDWANSIERGIERCALFLPIISHQSLAKKNFERYFWREWRAANYRAEGMALAAEFIIPIVVADDLRMDQLPITMYKSFTRVLGIHLQDGIVIPEFAARLQVLVRDFERNRRKQQ